MSSNGSLIKLSLVLLLALFAKVLFAAEARPSQRARTSASTSSSSTVSVPRSRAVPVVLSIGPGLFVVGSQVGFGLNVGGAFRVARAVPVYVGLNTGLDFVSAGVGGFGSVSQILMPLMATATYRFELQGNRNIQPFAGIALGPSLGLQNADTNFQIYGRGGSGFVLSNSLSIDAELRLGGIGSAFYFEPLASLNLSL
jgi:hypothetical protein